jgi:hypothetical protein
MMGRAWALAASCVLVACNDRPDADGSGSAEGTGTGPDTESATADDSTGEPPFFGVRRNTVTTFVAADGSLSTRSIDPTKDGAVMWVVEVGSGDALQSFPGEYDNTGWLEFPGVPEGPYVMRNSGGRSSLLALDVRDVETDGVLRAGRSTALVARTQTPQLSLTVSSMAPFGSADELQLYSRNVDALVWGLYGGPSAGDTEINGWTTSWDAQNIVGEVPLVEPLAGDDLWLTHLVDEPLVAEPMPEPDDWSEVRSRRLVEASLLELDQAIDDGVTANASGSFVAVAAESVSLDLRLDPFLAEIEGNIGMLDHGLDLACRVQVVVAPGEDEPVEGTRPTLAEIAVGGVACPSGGCVPVSVPRSDRVVELGFGNPFEFGTEMLDVRCWGDSRFTHPGTRSLDIVTAHLSFSRPLADAGPVTPALGMPSDIQIDGQAWGVNDVLTGVGTTPTISFSAPSLGTADSYAIVVMWIQGDGGYPEPIGTYETTATSFTLPAGLLEPGIYYHLQVEARSGRRHGEARAYSHAQHVASSTSGVFTP